MSARRVLIPLAAGVFAADAFEHVFVVGNAMFGIADRWFEHLGDSLRTVFLEERE